MQLGIQNFIPEIILTTGIFLTLLFNARASWVTRGISFTVSITMAIASLLALAFVVDFSQTQTAFMGILSFDPIANVFRILFYVLLVFIILHAFHSSEIRDYLFGENIILMMASTIGMVLMVSANDLLMTYLAIEIVSLTAYLMTGFRPRDKNASEAAIKYVLFGGVASAVMLFGMSYLYGMARTLDIREMILYLGQYQENPSLVTLAYIFLLVGFFYKIAAVPFHAWSPDVYQSASTPVTAFFSIGPKAAGLGVLFRFLYTYPNPGVESELGVLIGVISALTMTVGNLTALRQENIKRMLAYSSIAHAGYMMMGLVVFNATGVKAVMFYLFAYFAMNLGAFVVITIIINAWGTERIEDYRELAWKGGVHTFLAVIFAVFLFSLAGIPPFAGFIGKWYLFAALVEKGSGYYWLAVIGVLNSVVGLFYYARVIKKLFLDRYENPMLMDMKNKDWKLEAAFVYPVMLTVLAVVTVVFGIFFSPVFEFMNRIL